MVRLERFAIGLGSVRALFAVTYIEIVVDLIWFALFWVATWVQQLGIGTLISAHGSDCELVVRSLDAVSTNQLLVGVHVAVHGSEHKLLQLGALHDLLLLGHADILDLLAAALMRHADIVHKGAVDLLFLVPIEAVLLADPAHYLVQKHEVFGLTLPAEDQARVLLVL